MSERELLEVNGGALKWTLALLLGGLGTFLLGLFDGLQNPFKCDQKGEEMNDIELQGVVGGAVSAALISSFTKAFQFIYQLGKRLGTIIIRDRMGVTCPL